jgi:hypothetical protein
VGKPEGKRSFGRRRRRWVDRIRMDIREIGWGSVEWIPLAPNRDQRRALVNTVTNFGLVTKSVSYRVGHEKVAQVKANNRRSRPARGGGGVEILTARLLTNCSTITQRNILTPERISQGHVQTAGGLLFRGSPCSCYKSVTMNVSK